MFNPPSRLVAVVRQEVVYHEEEEEKEEGRRRLTQALSRQMEKMSMDAMMSTSAGLSYHNAGDFYPRKFGSKPDVVPSGVTERKVGPLEKPDMISVDVINISDSGLFC